MNTKKRINKASGEYRFRRIPREKSEFPSFLTKESNPAGSGGYLNLGIGIQRIVSARLFRLDLSESISFAGLYPPFLKSIVCKNVSGSLEKLKPSSIL